MRKAKCRSLDPLLSSAHTVDILNLLRQKDEQRERAMELEQDDESAQAHQNGAAKSYKKSSAKQEKAHSAKKKLEDDLEKWNPFEDPNVTSEPYKTLVVARLDYDTTEKTLKNQFEKYGAIKNIRMVKDNEGKSRGYAFVEFERKEDFVSAYKTANQRKLEGRRIIVDFQKGRTMLWWRPRRLGGGEGGQSRLTREEIIARDRTQGYRKELREQKKREKAREREVAKEKENNEKSRSRSRDRKEKKKKDKERERENDERDRREKEERREERQRREEKERKEERREREKEKEERREKEEKREKKEKEERREKEKEREEKREKGEMEVERDRKDKKEKKERSRSKKKDKKEKKDKKDKKEYISMNVPVDEFK